MIKINESNNTSHKRLIVKIEDPDQQLTGLLNTIKDVASSGHSFSVVVDPGTEDESEFYIDGDGSCHIVDIKEEIIDDQD